MFCQKCGAEIQDGSVFCIQCGAKVEQTVNAAETSATSAEKSIVETSESGSPVDKKAEDGMQEIKAAAKALAESGKSWVNQKAADLQENLRQQTQQPDEKVKSNKINTRADKRMLGKILRIVAILNIVLFFCPQYLVSCSGEEVGKISTADVAVGIELQDGTEVSDPYPILFILPILAIIVVIILTKKEKAAEILGAVAGAATVITLLIEKSRVMDAADEYACTVKTLWGYWFYLLDGIIMAAIAIILYRQGNEKVEDQEINS